MSDERRKIGTIERRGSKFRCTFYFLGRRYRFTTDAETELEAFIEIARERRLVASGERCRSEDSLHGQLSSLRGRPGVYVLEARRLRMLKVGWSGDLAKRIYQIRIVNAADIVVHTIIHGASKRAETALKDRLARWRRHHDWFASNSEADDRIAAFAVRGAR